MESAAFQEQAAPLVAPILGVSADWIIFSLVLSIWIAIFILFGRGQRSRRRLQNRELANKIIAAMASSVQRTPLPRHIPCLEFVTMNCCKSLQNLNASGSRRAVISPFRLTEKRRYAVFSGSSITPLSTVLQRSGLHESLLKTRMKHFYSVSRVL